MRKSKEDKSDKTVADLLATSIPFNDEKDIIVRPKHIFNARQFAINPLYGKNGPTLRSIFKAYEQKINIDGPEGKSDYSFFYNLYCKDGNWNEVYFYYNEFG